MSNAEKSVPDQTSVERQPVEKIKQNAQRPKLGRRVAVLLAVVLGLGAIGIGAWLFLRPAKVTFITIVQGKVELALSVVGRARPGNLVDVRSPNAGQVIELLHDDGDIVAEDAPLAILRAQTEQAQTDADAARERAARAEVTRTQLAFNRTQTLAQRGFVAKAALDEARATLLSAQANLAAAAAIKRAAAARSGEFTITAPMAGEILVRPIDNGQVVSPDVILFQLGSLDGDEIHAEVDEAYADALTVGMAARAALSGSEAQFMAHITEISARIDPLTGGRLVKLAADTPMHVPSGRSVDVTIVVSVRPKGIVVPRQAIVDATTEPKVYVLDQEDVVRAKPVRIAAWPSLNAIIDAGLAAGDRVVLAPAATRLSVKVRPINSADAASSAPSASPTPSPTQTETDIQTPSPPGSGR